MIAKSYGNPYFGIFRPMIETILLFKHLNKNLMMHKVHIFKFLMSKFFLMTIFIISANELMAQENINFTLIKRPSKEKDSFGEEPLRWSVKRINNSNSTNNNIFWSTNFSNGQPDEKHSSRNDFELQWEILPDSENEFNSSILLDINPSINLEVLIPTSKIQK